MNTRKTPNIPGGTGLLDEAVKAFQEATGLPAPEIIREPRGHAGQDYIPDARFTFHALPGKPKYTVETKRHLRPALLPGLIAQLRQAPPRPMIVADHVNARLGARLREQQVAYLDTAGNLYMHDPNGRFHLQVEGRRPTGQRPRQQTALTAAGLKVLFYLLNVPDAAARPIRDLADAAEVAVGTTAQTMKDLDRLGLVTGARRARRLTDPRRAFRLWVEAYPLQLRPKLFIGRYEPLDPARLHTADPQAFDGLIGGEPAAARLTGYLKPGTWTFYLDADRVPEALKTLRLRPTQDGTVELLERFWHFEAPTTTAGQGITPPILTYADLMATGDERVAEVAEMVKERWIPFA